MGEGFDLAATARELFDDVPWRRYVAIGDSVTAGVGDPVPGYPSGGFCKMLADALSAVGGELEYHNLGRRHLTTAQIRETQLAPALALDPDLVTVLAGGNDLLAPEPDLAATEVELERIVAPLAARGATVLMFTMFDIFQADVMPAEAETLLRGRLDSLHNVIRDVSERHPVVLVDLALLPESADSGIYSKDLRHGNMRGHAINARAALEALAQHNASSRVTAPVRPA